jgi:hypothetical protein
MGGVGDCAENWWWWWCCGQMIESVTVPVFAADFLTRLLTVHTVPAGSDTTAPSTSLAYSSRSIIMIITFDAFVVIIIVTILITNHHQGLPHVPAPCVCSRVWDPVGEAEGRYVSPWSPA